MLNSTAWFIVFHLSSDAVIEWYSWQCVCLNSPIVWYNVDFIFISVNGYGKHLISVPTQKSWNKGDSFRPSETYIVKYQFFGHLLENTRGGWPEIWHAVLSQPLSELIRFWSRFDDFLIFVILVLHWLSEIGLVWGYPIIFVRKNGLKFGMLMYPDHLQNWLHFGHGLLIFPILAHFDIVNLVKSKVSGLFLQNKSKNGH